LTTIRLMRRDRLSAGRPTTGSDSTIRSYAVLLCFQALDSLSVEKYWLKAPTVGLIDMALSLRTISSCVWRWPMSLRASRESPLMSAASPTTTAIRSMEWRMSRAVASP